MNYTKHTTIEEYQAWLDTNPPLYQVRRVSRVIFQLLYDACDAIERICKRVRSRSSISEAYRVQNADHAEITATIQMINREFQEEINSLEAYHMQHRRIMEMVENEIGMEETLSAYLEMLTPAERP